MTKISGYALLRSAVDHHERGDLRNAEREYRKSIKAGHSHYAIFLNLGIICKNSGREEEAIHLYLKAIEVNPNHPGATRTSETYIINFATMSMQFSLKKP